MAGDWMKMRVDLFSYPKFLRLARLLWSDERSNQARYVAGDDACDDVTERASHDVTFAALFRVWAAVNAHGKVRGMDVVCYGLNVMDLDPVAGYEGFGEAMRAAGLVIEDGPTCLIFPNFLEHNEPACLRQPPASGAERTAKYRAKKKEDASRAVTNGDVPSRPVTPGDGREEKRREEKKEEEKTPLTPQPSPAENGRPRRQHTPHEADGGGFARFWEAYPRKEAKADALKAFGKLAPSVEALDALLAAVERQKQSGCLEPRCGRDGRSVIPYPASWLNGRRWEDLPPPAADPVAAARKARSERLDALLAGVDG